MRRGGTLSISGVYGGTADPMNMLQLFDKQIQIRMGQANVKAWTDTIMPFLLDPSDPWASRTSPPTSCRWTTAPQAYETFQNKQDGAIKILLQP